MFLLFVQLFVDYEWFCDKHAHLERTCKKLNHDFKLENHGWLYYSYSVRL